MFLLARIENVDEQAAAIFDDADVAMEARARDAIHARLHHELPEGVVHHRGLCPLTSAFCCQNAMLARTAALCAASCNTCRKKEISGLRRAARHADTAADHCSLFPAPVVCQ